MKDCYVSGNIIKADTANLLSSLSFTSGSNLDINIDTTASTGT